MNEENTRKKVIIGIIVAIIVVAIVVICIIFAKNNLNENTNNDLEKPKTPASTQIEDRPAEN